MANRFINDDVRLPKAKTAAPITKKELMDKIVSCALSMNWFDPNKYSDKNYEDAHGYTQFFRDCIEHVLCDCPIDGVFQTYNLILDNSELDSATWFGSECTRFLGVQQFDNLTFLGFLTPSCYVGESKHAFAMIYWDGNVFRQYLPRRGNLVYKDENWQPLLLIENEECDASVLEYVRKYGYDFFDVPFCWEAIENEIRTVIKVDMSMNLKNSPKQKRFINDDVKLKIGGRKTQSISKYDLQQKLLQQALSVSSVHKGYYDGIQTAMQSKHDEDTLMTQIIRALVNLDNSVKKDNKFNVSTENVVCLERMGGLMGFHTLSNGLTFYGFYMGGDWETPPFMILYWDGKKVRLYTPPYGNAVNLDCKCAFGSENPDLLPTFEAKYKKLGVWIEEDEQNCMSSPLANMYVAKYGFDNNSDLDFIEFEWTAIKQDIESRIEVK